MPDCTADRHGSRTRHISGDAAVAAEGRAGSDPHRTAARQSRGAMRLIADGQHACGHIGRAGIGVDGVEDGRAAPDLRTPPVPEMIAGEGHDVGAVEGQHALSATLPTMLPDVPPLPSCSVPAEIVVPPV